MFELGYVMIIKLKLNINYIVDKLQISNNLCENFQESS